MHQRLLVRGALLAVVIGTAVWLSSPPPASSQSPADPAHAHPPGQEHKHDEGQSEGGAHEHPAVPAEYQSAHVPAFVWTDERMLARGKAIHLERCFVCHGESGDGKGPAAVGLPLKPPDLRNPTMVGAMRSNYWFWRVSEGGAVEPFASKNSVMPAWKEVLSVADRWAVIAYHHTFSSHTGPHVTSEHPEMAADHSAHAKVPGAAPAPPTVPGGSGHKH